MKLCFLLTLLISSNLYASYTNFNTILIGERAAGMGGASTAMVNDPAASSYYNPATLSRVEGSSLSAAVNLYSKFDTNYSDKSDLDDSILKVNRGSIVPIPSASGAVHSFGNFALGLSVLYPHFSNYSGQVKNNDDKTAYINLRDESLWVGGSLAVNTSKQASVGFSFYYTSRTFSKSLTDRFSSGSVSTLITQEKTFTQNSLIYILGYYNELTPKLSLGLSYRFPSLQVDGEGSFNSSTVSSDGSTVEFKENTQMSASSITPAKVNLGLAYKSKKWTISADLNHTERTVYNDVSESSLQERYDYLPTFNLNLGVEYKFANWLSCRAGAFTNLSATRKIPENPNKKFADHIDMYGTSANCAVFTSHQSSVTLGGYYTGGSGHAVEQIANQLQKIEKNQRMFTFLVATSFKF